jgi:hypothetical protein
MAQAQSVTLVEAEALLGELGSATIAEFGYGLPEPVLLAIERFMTESRHPSTMPTFSGDIRPVLALRPLLDAARPGRRIRL